MVSDRGYRCSVASILERLLCPRTAAPESTDFVLLPVVIESKVLERSDTVASVRWLRNFRFIVSRKDTLLLRPIALEQPRSRDK